MVFSGAPGTPRISNNITEVDISKYKFNWVTPSFTNILEHLLIYKQVKVGLSAPTFSSQINSTRGRMSIELDLSRAKSVPKSINKFFYNFQRFRTFRLIVVFFRTKKLPLF